MAFGDRKKKKYRDFAEDINGEIVYNGELFNYSEGNRYTYSEFRMRLVVYLAAAFVSVVSAGTFAAPGTTNRFYIILPFIVAIIMSALVCYSGYGVVKRGETLRQFDVDGRLSHLKGESMLAAVFSAITIAAYTVNFFVEGRGEYSVISTITFPTLMLISFYSKYSIFRLSKDVVWDKQKKN